MERVAPALWLSSGKFLNATREQLAAALARTRWLGSPRVLPPSQVVSPMSDEWLRQLESSTAAHPNQR